MPDNAQNSSLLSGLTSAVGWVVGLALLIGAGYGLRHHGWGEAVWFAAMLIMTGIRLPHSLKNKKNTIVASRKDATEAVLLTAMFLAMSVLPLLHLATPVFAFANYTLHPALLLLGATLQIPFLWLFWRSHADLGRNWSPGLEVRDSHTLVTDGIYGRIRHPMYAAIWLSVLAQPLLIQNWIAGVLVVPAFTALYVIRVPREEAMMRQTFGADYDAYVDRTGRLWPR